MTKQANLADQVFDAAKAWLQRNVSPLIERIKALEERAPIPGEKGEKGDPGPAGAPGRDGADGKDGANGADGMDGAPGVQGERGEKGDPGCDGKDADIEVIKAHVAALVAEIPVPKDGINGRDGIDGKDGAPGPKGDPGVNGKDIDPDAVKATIEALVAAIPRPADGINGKDGRDGVDGKDGAPGERGADGIGIKGDPGMDGRDGRDGEPGRDAINIDILDGIDRAKRYQRGTYAVFQGGTVHAFRATDPLTNDADLEKCGWHVVTRGIASFDWEPSDDLRTITLAFSLTGEPTVRKSASIPVLIHRGIYKAETQYEAGDVVTWDGSMWIAKTTTSGVPKQSEDWMLSVKHGRDGRDGVRGEKGDRGAEGRAGRDATNLGPSGGRW